MTRIAVISTVRNDSFFTPRWLDYYGRQFGDQSLYLLLDGRDQPIPQHAGGAHFITMPYVKNTVVAAEKRRARRTSDFAAALFHSYDIVIAVDIDEFIVVDPSLGVSLAEYLSALQFPGSVSPLGLDVVQHPELEAPIDPSKPLLSQRRFAILSRRYTKPAIINKPLRWGSGQHRIKGRNFRIDPNLFLFHFGNVDIGEAEARTRDPDRIAAGWSEHQVRRNALFDKVKNAQAVEGDSRFASARREQSLFRPIYAWNKPGSVRGNDVIMIPGRFDSIV